MKHSLLYQGIIEGGTDVERFTYLGQGKIGVVHGFPAKLTLVDIADGRASFQIRRYDDYGGVVVPLAEADVLYAPIEAQKLAAFDRATGEERWKASMGNGRYAFMVPPVLGETHIAAANSHSGKLSILDKKTGKFVARSIRMPHDLRDYWPLLRAWKDKFIAIAADDKNDQWCIDLYDPAVKDAFVKTLYRFPEINTDDGKILLQGIEGDALYFFTEEGFFYKLDLLSGEVLEKHTLPDASGTEGWSYTNRYIHRHEGTLAAIGRFYRDGPQHFILRYALESGEFSALPIAEPEYGCFQFYRDAAYQLTKKGLARFDLFGDGSASLLSFEKWKTDISVGTFDNSSDTGKHWLVVEDKLLVVTDDDDKDACVLRCWDMG